MENSLPLQHLRTALNCMNKLPWRKINKYENVCLRKENANRSLQPTNANWTDCVASFWKENYSIFIISLFHTFSKLNCIPLYILMYHIFSIFLVFQTCVEFTIQEVQWSGVYGSDSLTLLLSLILFSQLKALVTCGGNVVLLLNGKLKVFLASEGFLYWIGKSLDTCRLENFNCGRLTDVNGLRNDDGDDKCDKWWSDKAMIQWKISSASLESFQYQTIHRRRITITNLAFWML